jgi:hypothetical protein
MAASRTRKGTASPAQEQVPQIQPTFPPNPVPPVRVAPQEPVERTYEVTGPREVGGVRAPGIVRLMLSPGAEAALIESGNIVPAREDTPPPQPEEEQAPEDREPEEPMTGAEKEGD